MKNLAELIRAGMASDDLLSSVPLDEVKAIKSESVPNYRFFIDDTPSVDHQVIYRDAYDTEEEFLEIKKLVEKKRLVLNDTISTEHVDRMSDVVVQSGLDTKAYKRNPQVLWAHDSNALPIGRGRGVRRGKSGDGTKATFADTEFYPGELNPHAEIVREMVFAKAIPGRSIGFVPVKMRFPEKEERDALGMFSPWGAVFEKSELIEYSVVPVPANAAAEQEKALARATDLRKRLIEEGTFSQTDIDGVFNATPITEQNAIELSKARQRSFVDFGGLGDRIREIYEEKEAAVSDPTFNYTDTTTSNGITWRMFDNQQDTFSKRFDAIEEALASLQRAVERVATDSSDADPKSRKTDSKDFYAELLEADTDDLVDRIKRGI